MTQGDLFADVPERPKARQPEPTAPLPAPAPPPPPAGSDARRRPVDAAQRSRAVTTFDRPILLAAGAGTGKTATLVARVLTWCLGPGWDARRTDFAEDAEPEDVALLVLRGVVAITFTEAAAAEMATRLGQALARVQRETENREVVDGEQLPLGLALELLPAPAELFLRSRALRAALDNLNVSTIHAFCRRLLAAHPLEVRLAPDFDVDAAGSRTVTVVREVLESFLQTAWADPIDARLLALAKSKKRIAPPEIEKAVLELLDQGARAADLADDPLDDATCARLVGAVEGALRALHELGEAPLRAVPKNQKTHDALDAVALSIQAVETARGPEASPRAAFETLSQELGRLWPDRAWSKLEDWRKAKLGKTELSKLGEDAARFSELARALHGAVAPLVQIDVVFLEQARGVVHEVLLRVEAELRRRGVATFNDLLTHAADLLTRNPGIARRERRAIDQLLVDEFQDTDALQCAIVQALALPADGDEAPSLFLVGDPKQSIFAWRNADLGAFDDFAARVRAAGGEVLELTENFRSVPEVLREVELCVRPVMEQAEGVQPEFAALRAHRASNQTGEQPAIEHWASWPRDPVTGELRVENTQRKGPSYRTEARALAADALHHHGRPIPGNEDGRLLAWKDVGVIFRALTDIEPYLAALREAGIPYEVQSDRKYYQRREVVDATALVRAVLDPNDLLALVTLLRSPLIGTPDAALLALWEERLPAQLAHLWRPEGEKLAELEASIRRAAARVPATIPGIGGIAGWEESLIGAVHALASARHAFREDRADVWVDRLRALFLPDAVESARFLGAYRLANLERFFRELLRTLEERSGDVQSLLRTLRANLSRDDKTEASRPSDSAQDAVQILTIHGAKGLEFGHVYLAQMHKNERPGGADETSFERRGGVTSYRLFGTPAPSFFETEVLREEAEKAERVRLLYVALTRACDRLVVLNGWVPGSKEPKSWRKAGNFADLLDSRPGARGTAALLAARARADDPTPIVDESGARWHCAALLHQDGATSVASSDRAESVPVARVRADAERLAALRTAAATHAARPFQTRASETHADVLIARTEARFGEPTPPVGRDVAKAVGTLVHRVLETGAEIPAAEALAAELALFAPGSPAAELGAGADRVAELFERMRANGIQARLVELEANVVARELPLLAAPGLVEPGDAHPVGFVSGVIDLVYRDPDTGDLVVADYKTDRVESEDDVAARTESYREQGRIYTAAVQEALGLDATPRFELWFLHAGRVVSL